MRILLGIGAVGLGVLGALLCAAFIGVGWWAALAAVDRIDRVTARLDEGLSETDARLARVESRLGAIRSEIDDVRKKAESIAAENPELPRVKAKIEELCDRLPPALERVNAIADSLGSLAAGLRTAADIVDQFDNDREANVRIRNAADAIDRAAEALGALQVKVDEVKSAKVVQLTRGLITLAQESLAASERLAEGLANAREEIATVRERIAQWRDKLVFWVYVTATANTLVWVWGGLGQVCLVGWGRRRFDGRARSA